jgi:hypothetical protein
MKAERENIMAQKRKAKKKRAVKKQKAKNRPKPTKNKKGGASKKAKATSAKKKVVKKKKVKATAFHDDELAVVTDADITALPELPVGKTESTDFDLGYDEHTEVEDYPEVEVDPEEDEGLI